MKRRKAFRPDYHAAAMPPRAMPALVALILAGCATPAPAPPPADNEGAGPGLHGTEMDGWCVIILQNGTNRTQSYHVELETLAKNGTLAANETRSFDFCAVGGGQGFIDVPGMRRETFRVGDKHCRNEPFKISENGILIGMYVCH